MVDKTTGRVSKLMGKLGSPIQYILPLGAEEINLNNLLNREIKLEFFGEINCTACGRVMKKPFKGYCYPCSQSLAACDMCILKPEQCHYHQGTCREPDWGLKHCFQPHYVYLANSSGVKVGITRGENIPYRWIDQGAVQALPIYRVANRYHSGLIEVEIAKEMNDKTNWRKMLQNNVALNDLYKIRENIYNKYKFDNAEQLLEEKIVELQYPVEQYPEKVKSVDFMKMPIVEGKLVGIKGQYLIFADFVLNIRKFAGFNLTFTVKN